MIIIIVRIDELFAGLFAAAAFLFRFFLYLVSRCGSHTAHTRRIYSSAEQQFGYDILILVFECFICVSAKPTLSYSKPTIFHSFFHKHILPMLLNYYCSFSTNYTLLFAIWFCVLFCGIPSFCVYIYNTFSHTNALNSEVESGKHIYCATWSDRRHTHTQHTQHTYVRRHA